MQILMPQIRVRKPFAAAFVVLCLIAAYLGLAPNKIPQYGQSDKGLHFVTFFILTISFYWILETSRRRLIHLTLLVITGFLAIGSEILQALLPNDRDFDPFDILANVVGSGLALAACSWYHRRMLERRRRNKHYEAVPGDELPEGEEGERDLELGEGVGVSQQETGRIDGEAQQAGEGAKRTVTEELDNWDENVEDDWDETEADAESAADATSSKVDKRAE